MIQFISLARSALVQNKPRFFKLLFMNHDIYITVYKLHIMTLFVNDWNLGASKYVLAEI